MSAASLSAHLRNHGLDDTKLWLAELKSLGVTSLAYFKHLEGNLDIFLQLEKKAKYEDEKRALKKILKIDEYNNETQEKKSAENKEEVEKWKKDAKTSDIEKQSISSRENISDTMVLQTSSGGRALQGIYQTKNFDDWLEDRQCLLKVPSEVMLNRKDNDDTIIEQFYYKHTEKSFKKSVGTLGCSIATGVTLPVPGNVLVNPSVSASAKSEKEKMSKLSDHERYSSTVKISTLQVASYTFKKSSLELSEDARYELKELLKIVNAYDKLSPNAYEKCKDFFELFGSHISLGPLTFGGYMLWTCSSMSFQRSQRETIETMQKNAISAKVGASYAGIGASAEANFEYFKGTFKGSDIEDVVARSQLEIKINGGPLGSTDIVQWKKELVENNSTWVLIDRGKRLVAVWDIIRISHNSEFGELVNVLRTSWEKITGLEAQKDHLDLAYNSENVIEKLKLWNNEGEELPPEQILDQLKHLWKVKQNITEKTGTSKYWISEYLTNITLQDFFLSLFEIETNINTHEEIKYVIMKLMDEEELKNLDTLAFQGITKITKQLYPREHQKQMNEEESNVVNFSSFVEFLNKKIAVVTKPNYKESQDSIAKFVEMGIRQLRLSYFETYEDILISILAFPFQTGNSDSVVHFKPLSPVDLIQLHESFSTEAKKFEKIKENALHLQCYLLLLAMKHVHATFFSSLMEVVYSLMKKDLEPPVQEQLLLDLKKNMAISCVSLISNFKPMLESLMESPQNVYTKQISFTGAENSLSLRNILEQVTSDQFQHESGEQFSLWDKNPKVHFLKNMGLADFYPKKLGFKDALCINEVILRLSLKGNPPTDPKQLPYLVLHQIMSCDSGSLSNITVANVQNEEKDGDDDDDYEFSDDEAVDTSSDFADKTINIHPIDCLLALLICCDDFLCQDLYSKLAKCQRAIPFIIPDPFTKQLNLPLWAMFSIIQEWKSTEKTVEQSHHIVSYPMPVVSFLRFGKNHDRVSNSYILNNVISESESPHNYFFHRDCPGGRYKRILGDGLVDMFWYLPSGKEKDFFPDAITFLNLHGDARQHANQTSFLSRISSMCFILISEEDLEYNSTTMESLRNFSLSQGGIILLNGVVQKPKYLKETFPQLRVIDLKKKNYSPFEIKTAIQQKVKTKLNGLKDMKSIEEYVKGTSLVSIENDTELIKYGQIDAQRLLDVISSHKDKNIGVKKALLPLQGETWCSWASYDKELHRQIKRGRETISEYTSLIEYVKDSIRSDQLVLLDSLSPLTSLFLKTLLNLRGSSNKILRNYFMYSLKMNLNILSRETMSTLQSMYQSVRKKLSDDSEHQNIIDLHKELEIVKEEIVNSSFGLEHFFRELGQVYEAALKSSLYGDELSSLPKAVAELLIDGYPLELMDGDAAHIPLEWVMAVLNETVNLLGDPNVFVVSVLGLQSTGKSTMLNTTFGVQFNVSAGRCTRGAYMQLLPLHEEIERKTNCSYVLVVDTEGLRAPGLDPDKTQKHDNELATFVIGLANTTIINIYGEVPGDIDDILQTSVHALLRMSQVRCHPSCQFVYQNASVTTTSEIERAKFTQKLNRFTQVAAKEEHCEDQFKCFNDVIEFDDQTDVHYFPGLWKGDPPMAPVNQGYSRAAQQLKQHIIKIVCNRASKSDLSLSSFRVTVSDLWNALLSEKFVFSFKNTLEITAYKSLETAYSKWQWRLREAMLNLEHKAENVIKTENEETLPKLVTQKIVSLKAFIDSEFKCVKVEMEQFFNGKQSELLAQWKVKFELRIHRLLNQLKKHAEDRCNRLLNSRKAISAFERRRKRDAEEIKRKVQEHIQKIKHDQKELYESIKHGKLKLNHIKKLLGRDLFTSEKLAYYTEQTIITPDQAKYIQSIIKQCGSKVTEDSLQKILSAETLRSTQVESILKTPQSEKELKIEFEKIWFTWTKDLHAVSAEAINVEEVVRFALTEFVKAKGYEGILIQKLSYATVKEWGHKLDFIPQNGTHYYRKTLRKYVKGKFYKANEPYPEVILKITQDILHSAQCHLQNKAKNETDFQDTDVLKLLDLLQKEFKIKSKAIKDIYTLSPHYYVEMYVIACGLAIPTFESMAMIFQEKNDPLKYLETKEKGPLFIQFKNQYDQTEAEEAIADSLCAYLEEPIKIQVRNLLGPKLVSKMKASRQEFHSKMALKVKVLCDLHDKAFTDFMSYVEDPKTYLKERLEHYTIAYCNEKIIDSTTRLQQMAKEEINCIMDVVTAHVTDTNEKYVHDWLVKFCNDQNFRSELGEMLNPDDILCGCDASQQLDLEDFKFKVIKRLQELKKSLYSNFDNIKCEKEMKHWKEKPHQLLQDLIGCTRQCPFCREQCDLQDPNHIENGEKHRVAVHRPHCVRGMYSNNVLVNSICPEAVANENIEFYIGNDEFQPYSKYQDIYPDWSIPPDVSANNSLYWKMFVAKHANSLAAHYKKLKPVVESHWMKLEWCEVEKDLKKVYHL